METGYKYDAFISYRHLTPDKPAAERLQKLLENYTPPKGIEKKKLHIFRDESELPTSSDLGEDIQKALAASKYLIVVCSPEFEKSKWCMNEVEYFRELHGGNNAKILTLAVGDPDKPPVFPDILCHEKETETLPDGTVREYVEEVEPLAANVCAKDTKGALKKLKSEFLRIAAPLLGCGYDDLYRRDQKRKNRKRLAVGAAALAAMTAVTSFSVTALMKISSQKTQIEESAREVRINYANLSLSESKRLEKEEDIYGAMEAVEKSFPDEGEDFTASNGALEQTASLTGAYKPDSFSPFRKVSPGYKIDDHFLFEDGKRLFTLSSTEAVLWNAETGERINEYPIYDSKIYKCRMIESASCYISTPNIYTDYTSDVIYGDEPLSIFRKTIEDERQKEDDAVCFIDNDHNVIRISPDDGSVIWSVNIEYCSFPKNSEITPDGVIVDVWGGLAVLDPETGDEICRLEKDEIADILGEEQASYSSFYSGSHLILTYKPADSAAKAYVMENKDGKPELLYTLDLRSDTFYNTRYMICGNKLIAADSVIDYTDDSTIVFSAFDIGSGSMLWSYESASVGGLSTFIGLIPESNMTSFKCDILFGVTENEVFALKADTGDLIASRSFNYLIRDLYYSENGLLFVIDENSCELCVSFRSLNENNGTFLIARVKNAGISVPDSSYCNNVYAIITDNKREVILYRYEENDLKTTVCEEEDASRGYKGISISPDGRTAALADHDPNTLTVVDLEENKAVNTFGIEDDTSALNFELNYITKDHLAVTADRSVSVYDASSGELLKRISFDISGFNMTTVCPQSGELFYSDEDALYSYSPGGEAEPVVPYIETEGIKEAGGIVPTLLQYSVSPSGNLAFLRIKYWDDDLNDLFRLCIYDRAGGAYTVDYSSNTAVNSVSEWFNVHKCVWSDDEKTAFILDSDSILCFDCAAGELICRTKLGTEVADVLTIGDRICVFYQEDATPQSFLFDGNALTPDRSLDLGVTIDTGSKLSYSPYTDGRGFLRNSTGSKEAWFIDEDGFEIVYRFDGFCGFNKKDGTVYVDAYNKMLSYPILSADEVASLLRSKLK